VRVSVEFFPEEEENNEPAEIAEIAEIVKYLSPVDESPLDDLRNSLEVK
jgi:hypothetical protein